MSHGIRFKYPSGGSYNFTLEYLSSFHNQLFKIDE